MFDPELERFKRNIDLHSFAETLGYRLDLQESWGLRSSRPHYVMRNAQNDKVTIAQDPADGHWVYTSDRDARDNGSIIEFVQRRLGGNLGHVRKRLRIWSGASASLSPWVPPAGPVKDRQTVLRAYGRMQSGEHHAYLMLERRIPAEVLSSERFAGRVRIDERGNAIFPHFDAAGLCGFEKKGRNFTGFAEGGIKGLFESHDLTDDDSLVLAESAIDALSYAALFPARRRRYRSTGGNVSEYQLALITAAVLDLPEDAEVIAAMDNDPPGHILAELLATVVRNANRPSLTFRVHTPAGDGADWNDILNAFPPSAPAKDMPRPSQTEKPAL